MTKKLAGLLLGALFCVGIASAGTFTQNCGTDLFTFPGGGTVTATGNVICGGEIAPAFSWFTAIDLVLIGSWDAGNGPNTMTWTYTVGNPAGITLSGNGSVETLTGGYGPQNGTWNNPPGCIYPDSTGITGGSTYEGEDCTAFISGISTTAIGSFSVTAANSWLSGAGVNVNGDVNFTVFAIYDYINGVSTPEPSSLLTIGGGLIGLAMLARRRRQ